MLIWILQRRRPQLLYLGSKIVVMIQQQEPRTSVLHRPLLLQRKVEADRAGIDVLVIAEKFWRVSLTSVKLGSLDILGVDTSSNQVISKSY